MKPMIRRFVKFTATAALLATLGAPAAFAQILPPGGGTALPPPPAPPPPPSMAVPVVPQLDAPPPRSAPPPSRGSFGDRVTGCLQDGAAAGLNAAERATYSRQCANR